MNTPDRPLSRRGLMGLAAVGAAGLVGGCGAEEKVETRSMPRWTSEPRHRGSAGITDPAGRPSLAAASPVSPAKPASSPTLSSSAMPSTAPTPASGKRATPAQMIRRATVPVLCYREVRPHGKGDSRYEKRVLVIEPAAFTAQLDAITDAGYTSITPDEYLAHLTTGRGLPPKPVMLTFDGGRDNQGRVALPAVLDRGMKAAWFPMTAVLDKKGWATKAHIEAMARAGIVIGCHTWDGHSVRGFRGKDYARQIDAPRKRLQDLSGQPVATFAFPDGAWKRSALPHLEEAGFTTAFQLDERALDERRPALTLRRTLAGSSWNPEKVVAVLDKVAKG